MWKFGENHLANTSLLDYIKGTTLDESSHNSDSNIRDGIIYNIKSIDGYIPVGVHSSISHTINSYPKNAVHILQNTSTKSLNGLVPNMLLVPELRTFEHVEVDGTLRLRIKREWKYSGYWADGIHNIDMADDLFYYDGTNVVCIGPVVSYGVTVLPRYSYSGGVSVFKVPEFPMQSVVALDAYTSKNDMLGLIYVTGDKLTFEITSYDAVPLLSFLPLGTKIDLNPLAPVDVSKLVLVDIIVEV